MFTLISSIPLSFHTPDLRNFFSFAVEKEFFVCFNYRHRPHECQLYNVCVCQVKEFKFDEFVKLYHGRNWINTKGELDKLKCSIVKIKMAELSEGGEGVLSERELSGLLEFAKIPKWMPQGNVGTPTKTFIEYINQCIMPHSLIAKLGLDLKGYIKHKKKIYSSVEYKYDVKKEKDGEGFVSRKRGDLIVELDEGVASTARGEKILTSTDDEKEIRAKNYEKSLNENKEGEEEEEEAEGEDDDGDDLEEWERHEALHDDVTKQDRTSPYFFEEEIELKWEKGGSGLVFYTDANFWKEHENKDFDAETADDLDVDMSVYYEADAGDKDARELMDMRREEMRREGASVKLLDEERFGLSHRKNVFKKEKMGSFEKHTKGLGRRMLEMRGWKEGEPIGLPSRGGLKEPLDASDGKIPSDKSGIGYHGEKVVKQNLIEEQRRRRAKEALESPFRIGSKFDEQTKSDSLFRRFPQTMKYRSTNKKTIKKHLFIVSFIFL